VRDRRLLGWILLALLLLPSVAAAAQLQVATIRGALQDAQRQPVSGATILLTDSQGHTVAATSADATGRFELTNVAPGSYTVLATRANLTLVTERLVVRGSLPVELTLVVGATSVQEDVVVRGDASEAAVERPWSIAGQAVREATSTLPSQRVQAALATLPGWMAEDNGLLHVRGVDDGLLYVQDGVPIYARVDRLFGTAPNATAIESMSVFDGYVPPEFGFKSGGVIVLRSTTGLADRWMGTVDAGLASNAGGHAEAMAAGPLGRAAGLMVSGSSERSDRFLDPVSPDNLHNTGRSHSLAAQLSGRHAGNLFSSTLQQSRSDYDVPHDEAQDAAGQDARQRVTQWSVSGSWQRVLSQATVWQLSVYHRAGSAQLLPSTFDTPISATSNRRDERTGGLWSLTHQAGRHTFKTGAEISALSLDEQFGYFITDPETGEAAGLSEAALAFDAANPFTFTDSAQPWFGGVFAQDSYRASGAITIDYGVRVDRSVFVVPAWQVSPRVGVAYRAGASSTLRASALRLFQPPQAEYLLLASSPEARALSPFAADDSEGGADLQPERQTAVEVALSQRVNEHWRIDAAGWARRGTDVNDPNVFFGTTVTVPNSVARQQAYGFDLRADMEPWRGLTFGASYSHAHVVQFGPITGGLFLEDNFLEIQDGTKFIPDHDQRHALSTTFGYGSKEQRWRVAGSFRYRTGTPVELDEDELDTIGERPGGDTVDVETGRVRPQVVTDLQAHYRLAQGPGLGVTAIVWMDNIFNTSYAFNFGNPFSGTHFGAPRRLGVTIHLTK